jgi:hypothetical protein
MCMHLAGFNQREFCNRLKSPVSERLVTSSLVVMGWRRGLGWGGGGDGGVGHSCDGVGTRCGSIQLRNSMVKLVIVVYVHVNKCRVRSDGLCMFFSTCVVRWLGWSRK